MTDEALMSCAREAMRQAYAPYSGFRVGAALLTGSGRVYQGCNVENASYGATICAERTAIVKAVSEGEREFDTIAIICSEERQAYPCGICLQVMSEFFLDGRVLLEDGAGIHSYQLRNLLPSAFRLSHDLGQDFEEPAEDTGIDRD